MKPLIVIGILTVLSSAAFSTPNEAWKTQRAQAEYSEDYDTLKRLDYLSKAGTLRDMTGRLYSVSCCGPADAYEADIVSVDQFGNTIAELTCNTPHICEEIQGKVTRPQGTKFRIPPGKTLVNVAPPNNTGHGWVWVSPNQYDEEGNPTVYCYTEGTGG